MENIDELLLETNRTILRAYKIEDADLAYPIVSNMEIARTTVNIPHPYSRGHVDVWINYVRDCMINESSYEFAIFKKDDPQIYIGNCALLGISKEHLNAELGYFINPEFFGKEYATEACKCILSFGFNELGLERISGRCMNKNIGSKMVMEKCHLTYEGLSKNEVLKWNNFEDVCRYGMIKSEWLEINNEKIL